MNAIANVFNPVFSGSYHEDDCTFLLKKIHQDFTDVEAKEVMIQKGLAHYSETISEEKAPSDAYMALFHEMMDMNGDSLARDVLSLADMINSQRPSASHEEVVIVSLARAGTPIGVLLTRALRQHYGRKVKHYSISIIRDKGVDARALDYIRMHHNPESVVFVDGWTAKGVITRELKHYVGLYNQSHGTAFPEELHVISDIGGATDYSPTLEDYVIPSALLNSIVSGLVSRTILNDKVDVSTDFHACVQYDSLADYDISNEFVNAISALMERHVHEPREYQAIDKSQRQQVSAEFVRGIQQEYAIETVNRIKPGVAEATRVMLRRVPDLLMVKDATLVDVKHLIQLADEKGIEIQVRHDMPFNACAIIQNKS